METNLEHEDLLIKLRGKLNEEKVKLWEPPYTSSDDDISPSLQELAEKYALSLSLEQELVLSGLYELQQHSMERFKANEQFKETGFATFRIKVTLAGQKPQLLNIQKKLDIMGEDLIETVGNEAGVSGSRVKLIYNGKVIKPTPSLEEQGLLNGVQLMALIMAESKEQVVKEDKIYQEMKSTLEDATLLTEQNDFFMDEEYMNLEDQSGKSLELPPAERRSLMIGLALHERGRSAAKQHEYSLALVLFLEADRQLNECSSSILKSVDNWAVLQLDIAWCYLCLRSLPAAADAAARLLRAEKAFKASYGEDHERLIALKGTAANERVLLMRLYLLQGIVAYHQNKRTEARRLLEKAEVELNALKVDENAVTALVELGWTSAQARSGLRASAGDLDRAHHYLADRRDQRDRARENHRLQRQRHALGTCADGSPVSAALLQALQGMGYARSLAALALRRTNNHAAEAVRLMQDTPELLIESDPEDSDEMPADADNKLVAELEALGYAAEHAAAALRLADNRAPAAAALLAAARAAGLLASDGDPSTSQGNSHKRLKKFLKTYLANRKRERKEALHRLAGNIRGDEDDHLDAELLEEEQFLAQYKSLL
ncbi:NEDD8 ultimate buster 1 [Epargyreus clarus]|uniref:NEDD8 ultimate buster 1 n=1 Tax=Epargyreus clarus TaxID=520877 RepID=UPI003C2CD9DE